MLTFSRSSRASGIILAGIEDLKRDVIGDGSDKRGVERMVLNVVDDRGVVRESAAWSDCLVTLGVCSNVPGKLY